jgi:anti-anti-sigma factor
VDLDLTRRTEGDAAVVTASGELDVYTASRLRDLAIEITAEGPRAVVLDLDGVTFLDTTGLAVVVGIMRRARRLRQQAHRGMHPRAHPASLPDRWRARGTGRPGHSGRGTEG